MEISLILVPYHLGLHRIGMGLGPERILQAGIDRELGSQGHGITVVTVRRQSPTEQHEIIAVAEINALLAQCVRGALDQGHFPIVLAGNCNTCLGTLAGIAARPVGIVWLDAHGDFNAPETSHSGFLDGMALAMAAGLCYETVWSKIGSEPIPGSHIVHIGGRDFDNGEKERLEGQHTCVVTASQVKQDGLAAALRPALLALRSQVEAVYLHMDMDALDPAAARANAFAGAPDGLSVRDLGGAIRMVGEIFHIAAAAVTAYDPACDEEGRVLDTGLQLICTIVDTVA